MTRIVAWLRLKHTSIIQAIGVVIASGQVLGWWTLTADQIAAILGLVGVLWLIIGANTTTSNLRLTGHAFEGPNGADLDKVTKVALGDLATIPIPDEYLNDPHVDLSDAETAAGLD